MRYMKFLSLYGFLLLSVAVVHATPSDALYEAEVPVEGQGPQARFAAMADALREVLVKVGGSSARRMGDELKEVMQSPDDFVQTYRYRNSKLSPTGEMLWISFDRNAVDRLLRLQGGQAWNVARPKTLLWFVVEEGARRVLVGSNDQGVVRQSLKRAAETRGLPLHLPLLDLADQSVITPGDVWAGFDEAITTASARYTPQAILLARMQQRGDRGWEIRWTLKYGEQKRVWTQQSVDVRAVITEGIDRVADTLQTFHSSEVSVGAERVLMQVNGVKGLNGYRRVMDSLGAVRAIDSVMVRETGPETLLLELGISGGREAALRGIDAGDILIRDTVMPAMDEVNDTEGVRPVIPAWVYRLAM